MADDDQGVQSPESRVQRLKSRCVMNKTALTAINESKAALRQEIRARVSKFTPEQCRTGSKAICARLQTLPSWRSARTVLLFAPMTDEPDIWPMVEAALAEGKITGLPRFSSQAQTYSAARVREMQSDICVGKYGIREPSGACAAILWPDIDLIVVPGVVFDQRGHRLGRGRGHYDRLLAQVRGVKCGVAFDVQIVNEIPAAEHDVPMNVVLTPTRTIQIA